ncbi:MAG: hypothetical protein WCK34_00775 [Bacteroidota bacterium]
MNKSDFFQRSFFWILFITGSCSLSAQNFQSGKLSAVFGLLPKPNQKELLSRGYTLLQRGNNKYLVASCSEDTVFVHIGLNITDNGFLHPGIKRFLERTFLEVMLQKPERVQSYLSEENIRIGYHDSAISVSHPSDQLARFFTNDTCSVFLRNGTQYYNVGLIHPGRDTLFAQFPANVFLITGMDKKELDDLVETDLTELSRNREVPAGCLTDHKQVGSVLPFSFIPDFRQKEYFQNNVNFKTPAAKKNQLLANLFLDPEKGKKLYQLSLTHIKYGNRTGNYHLDLNALVEFFAASHQLYFYCTERNDDQLEGQLIFYQPDLNYYHSLEIITDPSKTDFIGNPINVRFLAYISIAEAMNSNEHARYKFGKQIQKIINNKKK